MRIQFLKSIKEASFIILIAIVCGLLFNNYRQNGIPLIAQTQEIKYDSLAVAGEESGLTALEEPMLIPLEAAYELFLSGGVLFIDAREKPLYDYGHIPNSISLPWKFEAPPEMPPDIPQSQSIVTYCSDAGCEMAFELANHLFNLGYHNIRIFHGGYEEWTAANFPTEKGDSE